MDLLISLIILLVIIGALLYAVNLIPMDARIKQLVQVVIVVFLVIYLLGVLVGYFPRFGIRG